MLDFLEFLVWTKSYSGGVLSYISHIGMYRTKGYAFWTFSGLKTGKHFAHFGRESSMVFGGTTGA